MNASSTDPLRELPRTGRLLVEASAGTGKTFQLAGLVARLVAERDVPIGEIVVVTFTRTAAAELRERVRSRLVAVADGLARLDGPEADLDSLDDPVVRLLGDIPTAGRRSRIARLRRATADFDAAVITTIHGFCQQVLAGAGAATGHDPRAPLVADLTERLAEACSDVLACASLDVAAGRLALAHDDLPKLRDLLDATRALLANPATRVVGGPGDPLATPANAVRARLVTEATSALRDRLARDGVLSYDDLLVRTRRLVRDHESVRAEIRDRFQAALVDEFQDTDQTQWDIFERVFAEPADPRLLVLVGDPKQAIYRFRGGDVLTYLAARGGADLRSLEVNWRSDGVMVDALNLLMDGAELGHAGIVYQPVRAAEPLRDRRLVDAAGAALAPLAVRVVDHDEVRGSRGIMVEPARRAISRDVADQIVRLLERAPRVADPLAGSPTPAGPTADRSAIGPGDIAVLVKAHADAPPIQRALARRGIPSVVGRGSSVLDSAAAEQWRRLLFAMAQPANVRRARAAALGWFVGWDAQRLDRATDAELAGLQRDLAGWSAELQHHGIARLARSLHRATALAARVMQSASGDRDLTDVDHIAELLHDATAGRPATPAAALNALSALTEASTDEEEPLKRRVESDGDAVQIMTVHAAKGLEFDVVCVPTMWSADNSRWPYLFSSGAERWLDASRLTRHAADEARTKANQDAAGEEDRGELRRLAYVGLTRGRHRTIVWWVPHNAAGRSGLGGLLSSGGDQPARPTAITERLERLAVSAPHLVELSRLSDRPQLRLAPSANAPVQAGRAGPDGPPPVPAAPLERAVLARPPRRRAGRWSFTTLAAQLATDDDPAINADPHDDSLGERGADDEGPPLPLADVPAGAAFGTMVHAALEQVDFAAPDLRGKLRSCIEALAWLSDGELRADQLTEGLALAVATPLGAAFDERSLGDIARTDRLDELDFELPLGQPHRAGSAAGIGQLLCAHLPPTDPMRPWAERLAADRFDVDLAGYLTGSIDGLFRLWIDGNPRFVVVDYKTNWLGRAGSRLVAADYHPERLASAMAHHDYPLQATLYAVAAHRFLRWRVPGYEPARHLGPVGYLFLRGMVGPATPRFEGRPYGVFAWQPSPSFVVAASDLLDGWAP